MTVVLLSGPTNCGTCPSPVTCQLGMETWLGDMLGRIQHFMEKGLRYANLPACPKLELSMTYCADVTATASGR